MPVTALVQPGPGGGHHAAELAGLARVAVGGVRGDLLVAHVDDADALVDAAVVDVDDVAAAEREDRVDALVLQRLGDQVAARDHARVAALALQGVVRGGGRWRRSGYGVCGCHSCSEVVDQFKETTRWGVSRLARLSAVRGARPSGRG